MPRSTIHFYVREGLLPRPAKTAASRSLYSEDHVKILEQIGALKAKGLALAEIRRELQESLDCANNNGVDLAAHEYERTHQAILRIATQEFMSKGYQGVHVAAVMRKAGVTAHVFYAHFPSKRRLLIECFSTLIRWNVADRAPDLAKLSDFGERLLCNLVGDLRVQELGAEVLSVVQSEGTQTSSDLHGPVEQAYRLIVGPLCEDLEAMRAPKSSVHASPGQASSDPKVPDELVAYSLLGAMDGTQMRASWDDRYTRADVIRTHLWVYLAIWAAMSGEVDIGARLARYEELVQSLASRELDGPVVPDE